MSLLGDKRIPLAMRIRISDCALALADKMLEEQYVTAKHFGSEAAIAATKEMQALQSDLRIYSMQAVTHLFAK